MGTPQKKYLPSRLKMLLRVVSVMSLFCLVNVTQASVVTGGTRIIFHEKDDHVAMTLINPDTSPYLVQSWVSPWAAPGKTPDKKTTIPFIVTPPLFRMEGGDRNTLNIVGTGAALPEDQESVWLLNVRSIPSRPAGAKNTMLISVKSSLKLFYRPASLSDEAATSAWQKVNFRMTGKALTVSNPTPFYITFYSLSADQKTLDLKGNSMVAPRGTLTFPVPAGLSPHHVTWQAIGDAGQVTSQYSISL